MGIQTELVVNRNKWKGQTRERDGDDQIVFRYFIGGWLESRKKVMASGNAFSCRPNEFAQLWSFIFRGLAVLIPHMGSGDDDNVG